VCARDIQAKTGLRIGEIHKELDSRLHAGDLIAFGEIEAFFPRPVSRP
jgi:hypothetical protein